MKEPILKLDDAKWASKNVGSKKINYRVYEMACLIMHDGNEQVVYHMDGTPYHVIPKALNALPHSICIEMKRIPGVLILSMEDAGRFGQMSADHARAMNADIIEYNERAKRENKAHERDPEWIPIQLRKWRKGAGVTKTPYEFLVEELEKEKKKEAPAPPATVPPKTEEKLGVIDTVKKKIKGKKKKE